MYLEAVNHCRRVSPTASKFAVWARFLDRYIHFLHCWGTSVYPSKHCTELRMELLAPLQSKPSFSNDLHRWYWLCEVFDWWKVISVCFAPSCCRYCRSRSVPRVQQNGSTVLVTSKGDNSPRQISTFSFSEECNDPIRTPYSRTKGRLGGKILLLITVVSYNRTSYNREIVSHNKEQEKLGGKNCSL